MFHTIRRFTRQPLWIIGSLWSVVLLAPYLPGLPLRYSGGLEWRQEFVLALLFCATLFFYLKRGRQARGRLLSVCRPDWLFTISLTAFVLWNAASMIWAASPISALRSAFVWGAYLLFFLLMRRVAAQPRLLRASLTILAILFLVTGISSVIGGFGAPISLSRSIGLGEPQAIAVPMFTALALRLRRPRAALLCGATAILAWLTMLQTFERAPFIGATVALALLAILSIVRPQFRPRSWQRVLVVIAAFVCVTAFQMAPSFVNQDTPTTVLKRIGTTNSSDPNTQVRFLFWGIGLEMLRAHPLIGIGADSYQVAYADARAQFSARYATSPLINMNESLLAMRAHNEYVQILAELGLTGFALFAAFCLALGWAAWRALLLARSPLLPGAISGLLAFFISSGASSISFRWMGSGLLFFFAAALVSRFASDEARHTGMVVSVAPTVARRAAVAAFVFAFVMLCGMGAQAMNSYLHGASLASRDASVADHNYRLALRWNPFDAATHYNYGVWLYYQNRSNEAVPHLRYATAQGFNASICYAYLVNAETAARDGEGVEKTLSYAVGVYPRSVFLRTSYAAAIANTGNSEEAEREFQRALAIDPRAARGWWQLIRFDIDRATLAAQRDPQHVAMPGELLPEDCVFAVLRENKRRERLRAQEEAVLR